MKVRSPGFGIDANAKRSPKELVADRRRFGRKGECTRKRNFLETLKPRGSSVRRKSDYYPRPVVSFVKMSRRRNEVDRGIKSYRIDKDFNKKKKKCEKKYS